MAHENPSLDEMRRLLTEAKVIAVVGASSKPDRPSYGMVATLLEAGYRVYPVNPHETRVLGQRAYPSLEAVLERIDIVDVFRRPEFTLDVASEAVKIGAKALWLQLGIRNEEAAERAKAAGLVVVMDRCIGVMHAQLGVPAK
jgi:uncharacterized protein